MKEGMKTLVYTGDLPDGSVDHAGFHGEFKKGEPFTVPDRIAEGLLKRPHDWKLAEAPAKTKKEKED